MSLRLKMNTDDPGFAMLRADAAELLVLPTASRLDGRFAAENIKGIVKNGELITPEIAEEIEADDES